MRQTKTAKGITKTTTVRIHGAASRRAECLLRVSPTRDLREGTSGILGPCAYMYRDAIQWDKFLQVFVFETYRLELT